jgi:hypothetical protein
VTRKKIVGWKLLPTDYIEKKVVKIIKHNFGAGEEVLPTEGEKNYKQ